MNRAERRRANKARPRIERMGQDTLKRQLAKNGITPEDVLKATTQAGEEGYKAGVEAGFTAAYAGICLSLHQQFGFGTKRLVKVLTRSEQLILDSLTNVELCEQVLKDIGLKLNFKEAFDRVEEVTE